MKIRTFQTYCKEIGIKPVSGYTNAGYVTGLMREKGYSHLEHPVREKLVLRSIREYISMFANMHRSITELVYFYWINKSVSEPIYYIHIFYKKEKP
jgi:hypothetical protein